MLVDRRGAARVHGQLAVLAVSLDVLEEGQAESEEPFRRARAALRRTRVEAQQVADAAVEQLVFVAVVGVERRASDVGAGEDLLHDDVVVRLLVHERREGAVQEGAGLLHAPVGAAPL